MQYGLKYLSGLKIALSLISALMLLTIGACQSEHKRDYTPIPTRISSPSVQPEENPDDVVVTPGGSAYRANVHEQGIENPWPEIETVVVQLGSGSDIIHVWYRNYVVTKAGETRNNIFYVNREGGFFGSGSFTALKLYSVGALNGIKLFQEGGGGLIGQLVSILFIEVPRETRPGQYIFEIGLEIEGIEYGEIPCTVEVVQ